MKKSLLIALGVAALATTILTMTFNATNVSDNLSADPVEPNHTYVFNKATTPLTDNGDNTYTATKTLDTGSSLALNISYTSDTTWSHRDDSNNLFDFEAVDTGTIGSFVFSFSLFNRVNNPKLLISCSYRNIVGDTGAITGAEFPGTPDTSFYRYVSNQNGEGRWSVSFIVECYRRIQMETVTLSYNC